jgi:hypothetical protein
MSKMSELHAEISAMIADCMDFDEIIDVLVRDGMERAFAYRMVKATYRSMNITPIEGDVV